MFYFTNLPVYAVPVSDVRPGSICSVHLIKMGLRTHSLQSRSGNCFWDASETCHGMPGGIGSIV